MKRIRYLGILLVLLAGARAEEPAEAPSPEQREIQRLRAENRLLKREIQRLRQELAALKSKPGNPDSPKRQADWPATAVILHGIVKELGAIDGPLERCAAEFRAAARSAAEALARTPSLTLKSKVTGVTEAGPGLWFIEHMGPLSARMKDKNRRDRHGVFLQLLREQARQVQPECDLTLRARATVTDTYRRVRHGALYVPLVDEEGRYTLYVVLEDARCCVGPLEHLRVYRPAREISLPGDRELFPPPEAR